MTVKRMASIADYSEIIRDHLLFFIMTTTLNWVLTWLKILLEIGRFASPSIQISLNHSIRSGTRLIGRVPIVRCFRIASEIRPGRQSRFSSLQSFVILELHQQTRPLMRNEDPLCMVRRSCLRLGALSLLGVLGCEGGGGGGATPVSTPPIAKGNRARLEEYKNAPARPKGKQAK